MLMSYEIEFKETALKEWKSLDGSIKTIFKKKLRKVIENPRISANQLSGMSNCYKIKLREAGYRLVYQVNDEVITIFVISVGKRERLKVYKEAKKRL
jgi:mRNA interferase RelE/StbE